MSIENQMFHREDMVREKKLAVDVMGVTSWCFKMSVFVMTALNYLSCCKDTDNSEPPTFVLILKGKLIWQSNFIYYFNSPFHFKTT